MTDQLDLADFIREYGHKPPRPDTAGEITTPQNALLKSGEQITLRLEENRDRRAVEELTRAAFWDEKRAADKDGVGAVEHYLTHLLRSSPEFIPELDFVAEKDGLIVGHIIYSVSYVLTSGNRRHPTVIFGPLAVRPDFQGLGVGSALTRHSLKAAALLGYGSVLIFGHPTYYPRFGFNEAKTFGITTDSGDNFPAFMALELLFGDLADMAGSYRYSPVFDIDEAKAAVFDSGFVPGCSGWADIN